MCAGIYTYIHALSYAGLPRRSRHVQFALIAKGKFQVKWSLTWFVDKYTRMAKCVCVVKVMFVVIFGIVCIPYYFLWILRKAKLIWHN